MPKPKPLFTPIYFEKSNIYMFHKNNKPIIYTEIQARQQPDITSLLLTEEDVNGAADSQRYAINVTLLEELYGYSL